MDILIAERVLDPMSVILVLLAAVLLPWACVVFGVGVGGGGAPAIIGGMRDNAPPRSLAP